MLAGLPIVGKYFGTPKFEAQRQVLSVDLATGTDQTVTTAVYRSGDGIKWYRYELQEQFGNDKIEHPDWKITAKL